MSVPQFFPFQIDLALWNGNPFDHGIEVSGLGYDRPWFGEPSFGIFGNIWGFTNRDEIVFNKAEEAWAVTHIALVARPYDITLACTPVTDAVAVFDPVMSALGVQETKIVPVGLSVILKQGSMFIIGNIVAEIVVDENRSKMIS